ncbi:MAG TPA: zinc-binding dehydrogenase [Nitrososphaera sp.]|nr:zinc-binding dehydrogenase [Nitrososphaera sp.]
MRPIQYWATFGIPRIMTLSANLLRGGSGIIISMLERPNQELMDRFGVKAIFQFTQVNRERLTRLAQWVDQNKIHVNIDRMFPLDEAGKALDYPRDYTVI